MAAKFITRVIHRSTGIGLLLACHAIAAMTPLLAETNTGRGYTLPGHGVAKTVFPRIASTDLNGRQVTVPDQLNGRQRLVFLAYDRSDQPVVDRWINIARNWHLPEEQLGIYEIPIIQDPGRVARKIIDTGMRAGIPSQDVRRRVITLYTDKDHVLQLLGVSDDSTIDVLLLDSTGAVTWRTEGAPTQASLAELQQRVGINN